MEGTTNGRDTAWAMSEENVEIAREAIEAWNEGDMERAGQLWDPDAVMIFSGIPNWPERGPFFGRDAILRQFDRLRDSFDSDVLDPVGDPVAVGDRVVVHATWRAAGRGPEMDLDMAWVYTVHGGLIVRAQFFADHAEALKAAGLSE